jgi:hypothetical protein
MEIEKIRNSPRLRDIRSQKRKKSSDSDDNRLGMGKKLIEVESSSDESDSETDVHRKRKTPIAKANFVEWNSDEEEQGKIEKKNYIEHILGQRKLLVSDETHQEEVSIP